MYVKVRVRAKAKRESIEEKPADHFEVAVKEPAEMNLANRRVITLIAARYAIPVARVRIVSGHHSASKILSIESQPDAGARRTAL